MKLANFSPLLLLTVALSVSVSGCKKGPKGVTPIFSGRPSQVPGSRTPGGMETPGNVLPPGSEPRATLGNATGTPLAARPGDLSNYDQDRDTFKQDTIYFDFDKYNVRPGELPKVQTVADYLKGQSAEAVLIEGHCDERGTPEYNRALGERRADSVRESLISLGVSGDRIHTVSYGEDKPADPGHDERAFARNRRGEFVLLKPKAGAAAAADRQ